MVIVDDFSRFAWTIFLLSKDEIFNRCFCQESPNKKGFFIAGIRTDRGGEFENHAFGEFCDNMGIDHNFLAPRTPQQNGIVERKNRVLTEMARAMLNDNSISLCAIQRKKAQFSSSACF